MDEEPIWLGSMQVFACLECAVERNELSVVGFSIEGYKRFCKNELLMKCPICDYTMPQYMQKTNLETGEETLVNLWLPIHLPSQKEFVKELELVRSPPYNLHQKVCSFWDDKCYAKYYKPGEFEPARPIPDVF
jgi:hypothetical protein